MTHARAHCPLTEQAVGLALHALEPDEEMAVLQHIPHCADCQAAIRDTEAVLARFGAAVEQVDPPPGLRASILFGAEQIPQLRSPQWKEPATTPVPVPYEAPRAVDPAPPSGSRRSVRPGGGRGLTRRRLVALAAAALAVVSIGGLGVRAAQLQGERDVATAQAQSLTDLVEQLDKPHALLADDAGTSVAAVVLSGGRREVYTVGLPANTGDHTYVLWGLKAGTPQPLAAFDVASADRSLRSVGAANQDGYQAYAISLEPGRTAPVKPTDVVAKGALVV